MRGFARQGWRCAGIEWSGESRMGRDCDTARRNTTPCIRRGITPCGEPSYVGSSETRPCRAICLREPAFAASHGGIAGAAGQVAETWQTKMERVVVRSRVGSDGVLHRTVPVAEDDACREVRVTIDPVRVASAPMTPHDWREFVMPTAGRIADPFFVREEQG
jgi:hypothetical protein